MKSKYLIIGAIAFLLFAVLGFIYFKNYGEEKSINDYNVKTITNSESILKVDNETKSQFLEIDLNGDGVNDKIKFEALGNEEDGLNKFRLQVNDIVVERDAEYLEGTFDIVDIDSKDRFKEIVISEYGPSSDDLTYFYYYNGSKLISMGELNGLYKHIKITNDGVVETYNRSDAFGTFFYPQQYRLTEEHKFSPIQKELYEIDIDVTVKQPVPVRFRNTKDSIKRNLLIGEKIKVIAYNGGWYLIKDSTTEEGWFWSEDIKRKYGDIDLLKFLMVLDMLIKKVTELTRKPR